MNIPDKPPGTLVQHLILYFPERLACGTEIQPSGFFPDSELAKTILKCSICTDIANSYQFDANQVNDHSHYSRRDIK